MSADEKPDMKSTSPFYLGIIPARGGSKRIPRKNVILLDGKPLITYSIDAARNSRRLSRTIISTDDEEIISVARHAGGDAPFLRPAEIAADSSPMVVVIEHVLRYLEGPGGKVDAVVLLQPTSPFRTNRHIYEAIELFERSGADTVTSVCGAREHPYYSWTLRNGELAPFFSLAHQSMTRQELPPAFFENGAIFVVRREVLRSGTLYGRVIVPYQMDQRNSVDIDTPDDLAWAEWLIRRNEGTP